MTNQLLVCISASWDTVVNCPQNNIEKNGWFAGVKKYFVVGRIFLFPDWFILRVSQSVWAKIQISETDASTHRPPGSVKERFKLWYHNTGCGVISRSDNAKETAQKKNHPIVQGSSYIPNKTTPKNKQKPHNWLNKIHLRGQHRNISIA